MTKNSVGNCLYDGVFYCNTMILLEWIDSVELLIGSFQEWFSI